MPSSDKPRWVPAGWTYREDAEFVAGEWSWFMETRHETCGATIREWFTLRYVSQAGKRLGMEIQYHECP